jgi:hypothetical protein
VLLVSFAHSSAIISLPLSAFPPLAVGFFGLGTGYLIYGPQELFGFPRRDQPVDATSGIWGHLDAGIHAVHHRHLPVPRTHPVPLFRRARALRDAPKLSAPGQRLLGIFHIGTGLRLMYLTFAVGLAAGYNLPL